MCDSLKVKMLNINKMKRNVDVILKRKRIWDIMGYTYRDESNRLYKNHSLSCGCSCCRWHSFMQKKRLRDDRHTVKINLKLENYETRN